MKTDALKAFLGFDRGTMKVSTEIVAGLTTFFAMSYILAVNPSILSSTGMDKNALFTVTALASAISTLLVAVIARMPLGLAPGMGLNAFFAFTVCGAMGYDWKFALTAVFIEGVIFILLALSGMWKVLVDAIPLSIRKAITVGIGLFIAFLGFKSGGIVMDDPATFITLGDITHGAGLLSVIGLILTGLLIILNVPGALL
ncbi:MAG: NCS2 family permease, partial [Bacteroidales bacterium]|nr:NCS2 family permease [Bacteroidales bacterium]